MATRKTSIPGATETITPDPAENTTGTVSEPVAEQEAVTPDVATSDAPSEQAESPEPYSYEEYLAWKNSRAKQADEPVTPVSATTSTGAADSTPKRKRPVLGPQGWTQEEY